MPAITLHFLTAACYDVGTSSLARTTTISGYLTRIR